MKKIAALFLAWTLCLLPSMSMAQTTVPQIPLITGPQDISNTNATLNQVINQINGITQQTTTTVSFSQFGGSPGNPDNSPAMNAAVTYVCSLGVLAGGHILQMPTIQLSAGVYKFGSAIAVNCAGFSLNGAGESSTALLYDGTSALLSFGVYNAAPSNYFSGTGSRYSISNLQAYNDQNNAAGSRTGTFIQDNGSGSGVLVNVLAFGFQYGFAGAYGCDFMVFINTTMQINDAGYYFGPSCEQIKIYGNGVNATAYENDDGMILEGVGEGFDCFGCDFVNNGFSGTSNHNGSEVTIKQNVVGGTTTLGVTVLSSPNINTPKNFWGGAFEGGAGVAGGFQPLFFIRFTGTYVADAIRGLNVKNSNIIAGGSGAVSGSAFIGADASLTTIPRLVTVADLTLSGPQFSSWFNACFGTYENLNVVSGTSLIPISAAGASFNDVATHFAAAVPSSGYWSAGTMVWNNTSSITTGTAPIGWFRITNGQAAQANVLNTDWLLIVGHNT